MKTISAALSRSGRFLTGSGAVLAAITLAVSAWALLPVIPQDPTYHRFADQRQWLSVPNAADVLSNLSFALVGLLGAIRLASPRRPRFSQAAEAGLWCVALGLVGTALGSTWYHLAPNNASLVWDRLPMTLVFAGVLGTAIAQRAGNDIGRLSLALLVPLGIASVAYWKVSGDLSLYVALQGGGIVGLLLLMLLTPKGNDSIPWAWVLGWYALAKVAEFADQAIFDATHRVIAGHSLKHLLAAAAGAAVLWPLRRRH